MQIVSTTLCVSCMLTHWIANIHWVVNLGMKVAWMASSFAGDSNISSQKQLGCK